MDREAQKALPEPPPAPPQAPPPPEEPAPPPPRLNVSPPSRIELRIFPGKLEVGVGASAQGVSPHAGNGNGTRGEFAVGEGARVLIAELAWAGTGDLDLFLRAPDFESGDPLGATGEGHAFSATGGDALAPDKPARIAVEDLEGLLGAWRFEVAGKAAAQSDFTLYVTIFYNTAAPVGYSAIPA